MPGACGSRVEAVNLEPVDQEEAAITEIFVTEKTDLGPQDVERQLWIARGDHPDVTPPLHLEEPDGDPYRVLVGPNGGQIHRLLHQLGAPVGVLAVVDRRVYAPALAPASAEVRVCHVGVPRERRSIGSRPEEVDDATVRRDCDPRLIEEGR